jgi:hypothetical protein
MIRPDPPLTGYFRQMRYSKLVFLALFFFSCSNPVTKTVYRNGNTVVHDNRKILVIGVAPSRPTSMERAIEEKVIHQLYRHGFEAVSYTDAFAMYNMAMISQDAVGFILEENNIDYVLTIAQIDPSLAIPVPVTGNSIASARFYFDHIRKYRGGLMPVADKKTANLVWECLLFNVRSFEAERILHTIYQAGAGREKETSAITRQLVKQLVKAKQFEKESRKGF